MASSIIVPDILPPPAEDCQRLNKAFDAILNRVLKTTSLTFPTSNLYHRGWGTEEKEFIRVLGERNASQRKLIRDTYQQLYKESLLDALHSELFGDFGAAIILWTTDPPKRDAKLANEALKKYKKGVNNLKTVIEIACATSLEHLIAVRKAYCSLYDCSLEEDILYYVSSLPLRKLLVGLVSSYRYDKEAVDLVTADSEASSLHEAIQKKKLDDDRVLWILCTRNIYQLKATFECYKKNYGNIIDKDIRSSGNGDLKNLIRVAISCIHLPEEHFAEVINESVDGIRTDEDSLTRVIVSRAEIDMVRIKEQYHIHYERNLEEDVKGETSGDYRDFLMTLLGKGI